MDGYFHGKGRLARQRASSVVYSGPFVYGNAVGELELINHVMQATEWL